MGIKKDHITLKDILEKKGGTVKDICDYARQKGIVIPCDPNFVLSSSQLKAIDPLMVYKQKWGIFKLNANSLSHNGSAQQTQQDNNTQIKENAIISKEEKKKQKDEKKKHKKVKINSYYDIKIGLKKPKKIKQTRKSNPPIPLIRTDVKSITSIKTTSDVDSVIQCFLWPNPQYNREDDFYVQGLIDNDKKLLNYYHKKMVNYFGVEHILKKDYEQRKKRVVGVSEIKISNKKKIIIQPSRSETIKEIKITKPKEATFEAQNPKTWILDWELVDFHEGYFIVHSPNNVGYTFSPEKVYCPKAQPSFNYIRKFIKERVPAIFCSIYAGKLTITSPILINEAIMTFAKIARQKGINVKREEKVAPLQLSFSEALKRAEQMSPAEFAKYKSKYIDFLVSLQSLNFKVIPCVERLSHSTGDTTEYAFLFSVECSSGRKLIVHENVNPDRSTLLFLVKKELYNKAIRDIYHFLQSAEINKRSSLREKSIEIGNEGIISYKSINHDDLYSWKQAINTIKQFR